MMLRNARIQVVEDDRVMQAYLVRLLRRMNIEDIETCTDGGSALAAIEHYKPDLVLADIHMFPVNGFEFVQQLREHKRHELRNTRVIFVSADSHIDSLNSALPLGILSYIVKPPRLDTLRAKLEMALIR